MKSIHAALLGAALLAAATAQAAPSSPDRDGILADLRDQARAADPAFAGFSAERGARFFSSAHGGGKPDTPACTTCHGAAPEDPGQTRAGKAIAPMALSRTPDRYGDAAKVAKWFRRNCRSVLGRPCTAREKGDFITFMSSR